MHISVNGEKNRLSLRNNILFVLHGMILMAMFTLYINYQFEDRLYDRIASKVALVENAPEKNTLLLLQASHDLLNPRLKFFEGKQTLGVRDRFLRSSDIQLLDGGACGTHAHVLARLLQRVDIPVRIAQMQCEGHYGCHIVVEALVNGKYVVLDPLYNIKFRNKDNSLASFSDVQNNWSDFVDQLPSDYDHFYKYEGVRYTNWDKIPVVMPALKELMRLFIGNDVETLSLRVYVLNLYKTYFFFLLMLYPLLVFATYRLYRRSPPLV